MGRETERLKETRNEFINLARTSKGKRRLERSRRKWNDKIDVSEIVFGGDWILLSQNRVQKHTSRHVLKQK
jgi:hypothetical protein